MNQPVQSMSILIATHNRCLLLRQTLQSIGEWLLPAGVNIELIVCANACTDGTAADCAAELAKLPFAARCISEPTPGLSVARNRLLSESAGEVVAFLDDDVWVSRGWPGSILEVFNHYPADMVTGKVDLWWQAVKQPDWLSRRSAHMLSCLDHGDNVCEIFSAGEVIGANLALRRTTLRDVPNFRSELGRSGKLMVAGDDTDFVARAMQAGHRIFYAPRASLLHYVSPERITLSYLGRSAAGIGVGKVRMLGDIAPTRRRILKLENALKYCLYGGLELASAVVGSKKGRVNHHIRRMMCHGVLAGLAEAPGSMSPTTGKP
ncbi:MAG: glycosyltransferase family 2 protein [Phycisphaerales bacterium]|nr:glycosyltransferase family 2 protein [Phycisphaerales bacterium]